MTDLRTAAQQALEALGKINELSVGENAICLPAEIDGAMDALRAALAEPEPRNQCGETCQRAKLCAVCARGLAEPVQEQVAHSVIAGALFDFMGWLTARKERLVLSSTDNASPAADAIKDFAEMRGLLLDDARVQNWQTYMAPPQRKPLTDEEIMSLCAAEWASHPIEVARAIEAAHGIKENT